MNAVALRNNALQLLLLVIVTASGCVNETIEVFDGIVFPGAIKEERLEVPELSVGICIEGCGYGLKWSDSESAEFYLLESDMVPEFATPYVLYSGPERSYLFVPPPEYPFATFFRVRAENSAYLSGWSNIVEVP